jgi:hypothetical protein
MKTLSIASFVLICFSTLFFSSCAGKNLSIMPTQAEKFDALQDGLTTTEEVRIIFGIPDATLTKGKSRTWIYRDKSDSKKQTYPWPKGFQGKGGLLRFDSQGVRKERREVSDEELKALQTKATQETSSSKSEVTVEASKATTVELSP